MSTYAFDRNKRDFDGDSVADAFDYYFPEWRHKDGKAMTVASGNALDNERFAVLISEQRDCVARLDVIDGKLGWFTIGIERKKMELLSLFREGDSLDKSTDKRYLLMLSDFHRKNI